MNAPPLEAEAVELWRDAKTLSVAPRADLRPHLDILLEAQDEIASAIQKAQS